MIRFAQKWSAVVGYGMVGLALLACSSSSETDLSTPSRSPADTRSATSTGTSIESSAQEIALKFAEACFEIDSPTLETLSASELDWAKRSPGDFDVFPESRTCPPVARCLLEVELQGYPCRRYEVEQLRLDNTNCDVGTPADTANGLGSRCFVSVRLALRRADTTDPFRDTRACFLVQEQGGRLLVNDVGPVAPPTGCFDSLVDTMLEEIDPRNT